MSGTWLWSKKILAPAGVLFNDNIEPLHFELRFLEQRSTFSSKEAKKIHCRKRRLGQRDGIAVVQSFYEMEERESFSSDLQRIEAESDFGGCRSKILIYGSFEGFLGTCI